MLLAVICELLMRLVSLFKIHPGVDSHPSLHVEVGCLVGPVPYEDVAVANERAMVQYATLRFVCFVMQ